jgi:WD40 repeat protein
VRSVIVLSDGCTIASGSGDRTVKLWDTATLQCTRTLSGHDHYVYAIAEVRSGIIASGSDDQTIRVWSTATGECLATIPWNNTIFYLVSLPGGRGRGRLVSGSYYSPDLAIWSEEVE